LLYYGKICLTTSLNTALVYSLLRYFSIIVLS